jgi:hypothetical protein
MFENYNAPGAEYLEVLDHFNTAPTDISGTTRRLYNKNHQFYGVEAKHLMPFNLYFHLTESSGQNIDFFIKECNIEFSVYSKPARIPVIFKTLRGDVVFDSSTQDLKIEINQEEAKQLKQETYCMQLKLVYPTGFYILHSEQDGLLVIR